MLYLLNNVYLTPDKTVNLRPEDDSGFVSARMRGSSFTADNYFSHVYGVRFKAPLFTVSSYDELIKTTFGGKEQALFDLFLQPREGRLVIMCDEETMLKVATRTMKTILPNATAETGFLLLKYMYLPYFYLHDSGLISYLGPNDFQNVYINLIAREKDVKNAWIKSKPWKLDERKRARVQQLAGVELQTATYLANNKWKFASDYKNKVVTFAKKTLLLMLVNDLRQKVLDGFVDVQKLIPELDPMDRNVVHALADHPTFRFLIDPHFTPNSWEYVFVNYDMAALYALFQKYAPLRAFNLNDFSLLAKENNLTFEEVLDHEMQSSLGRRLIGTDINYKSTVNIYLLDMMFDLFKNNPSALREFSLESLAKR
jgi:hypothetical protein